MRRIIFATLIGAACGAVATSALSPFGLAIAQDDAEYRSLELFGDIFERVRSAYVEEVNEEELIENAINGMLASLDPHSSYLAPKNYQEMQEQTKGEFGGLGIEVTMENGFVKVVAPIDDTPAARAGLKNDDFITHLDGEAVLGLTLSEAVDKMRGKIGTDIILTISREGADEPFDVTITRDKIVINPVRSRVEGDIGYLRVTTFNQQTTENLETEIDRLNEEIGEDKLRGFVLDLRNNPGGLLTQAIGVSDAFLDKGEIVSTRGRDSRNAERHSATTGDLTKGLPIVVLINGGSASASEIVAGALQDHRRGIVVGTKSFGKGSVQTIMPLANRAGAIRLTTSRYYTPSGRSIQALGIEPDVVVEQLEVEAPETSDRQRSESSLRGALSNDTSGDEAQTEEEVEKETQDARRKLREEDYQLSYALDLLSGLSAFDRLRAE
ncbi:MAG: S41 family peptidase [Rhodobacteraceae bacterium]|nr:S41 family peptidase [Paracoccaceae bacterium]